MTKGSLRRFLKPVFPFLDVVLSPFTFLASLLLFAIRKMRISNMRVSRMIFKKVIRPQGDVLFEFLEILPSLKKGVIIHVHDIFSPGDYTKKHLVEDVLFWNEQYLLEAFLTCNDRFKIIGALNCLKKHHPEKLYARLPLLKMNPDHVPGSFWMRSV